MIPDILLYNFLQVLVGIITVGIGVAMDLTSDDNDDNIDGPILINGLLILGCYVLGMWVLASGLYALIDPLTAVIHQTLQL